MKRTKPRIRNFTASDISTCHEHYPIARKAAGVKIANHVTDNYGAKVYVERNISGSMNIIHLVTECESLAAWESETEHIHAQGDKKLGSLITAFHDEFVVESSLYLLERVS